MGAARLLLLIANAASQRGAAPSAPAGEAALSFLSGGGFAAGDNTN